MNIIYTHCSALIIIGDFKCKMARSYSSYNADWQRRKAVLIRSHFHDIPILSPVTEESNDSSQNYYVPNEEVFHSPPRPYSPLPPLIIEEVSVANKHDEPEEYYSKLYKKIKRIYKKLFIEKRNLSSIDYGSNYSNSSNDDRENISEVSDENLDFSFLENNSPDNGNFDSVIEDREARQSSASSKSNGYGADFESMDTVIIDVVNYTASNEDGLTISDEEQSDNESIRDDDPRSSSRPSENEEICGDEESNENEESSRGRIDNPEFMGREESHHSLIDDHEETSESEDEESSEKESTNNKNIKEHKTPEITNQTAESDTVRKADLEFSEEEPYYSSIDDDEKAKKQDLFENKFGAKEFETVVSEDETIEEDAKSSSSEGPIYRQVTTGAMVHFDGSPDAVERESRVYEDSVKSLILPTRFRRVVVRRNVGVDDRIETLSVLDENADSKTTPSFNTGESESTEDDFEAEMATLQPTAKEGSIMETRNLGAVTFEETDEQFWPTQPKTVEGKVKGIGGPVTATRHEDPEEIRTPQQNTTQENVEEIGSARLANRSRASKEIEIPIPETTRNNVQEEGAPRLDGPEEDEEITTPQPEFADEDDERTESPQSVARGEETEEIGIPLPKVTEEGIEELNTPRLDGLEEDDEEMSSPPDSEEEDVEGMGPHSIEQMRTPRAYLSHGTIINTHRSHSESTSDHTAVQQEQKSLTSSTQDGGDHNMSELQTSNDINEILTSIFNESLNKHGTPISERKRKYVDKSVQAVQTSRVTWEEMRANFFVGTPKIFRLCACADHIC